MDVQDVPETGSDERAHILDKSCWCHPETIWVEGTRRNRHRKSDRQKVAKALEDAFSAFDSMLPRDG